MDGCFEPLFSESLLLQASSSLKSGKCVDSDGVTSELLASCIESDKFRGALLNYCNERSCEKPLHEKTEIDPWQLQLVILIAKAASVSSVTEYRPITILNAVCKLYHKMLHILLTQYVAFIGCLQFGARKGYQATEAIMLI